VLTKEEILNSVWRGVAVSDGALSSALKTIRHSLGDDGTRQRLIQTLRGRGYRWVGPVEERSAEASRCGGRADGFVGRASTLAELRTALEEALAGRGRIALLVGEAGIGKTRTAEELAAETRVRGIPTHSAWCHEGHGAPSYWVWRQILRALAESRTSEALCTQLGDAPGPIARIVPEIQRRLPEPCEEPHPLTREEAQFRLFDAVSAFLGRFAAERGLVLIVDDLQWADPSSLGLLDFLVREIEGMRLLLVASCLEIEGEPAAPLMRTLTRLARHDHCARLQLGGLVRDEVGELVRQLTGKEPPATFTDALCEKTDGNPFLIRETVSLLEDRPPGDWHLEVSPSVCDVVAGRLGQLSRAGREALELASVLGPEFGVERLERVSDLDLQTLGEAIDEAHRAGLVKAGESGLYRFTHALFQEAIYRAQRPTRRALLHQRLGEALEEDLSSQDPGSRLAELAHHFAAALPVAGVGKAVGYARQAGDRAMELLAFEQAAARYGRALELLGRMPGSDPAALCDLHLALGTARRLAGERDLYRDTFRSAAVLARGLGDAERLARAAIGFVFWNPIGLVDESGMSLLEEALDALGRVDTTLRVEVLSRLAHLLQSEDQPDRADQLLDEATERATRSGDPGSLATAWLFRGFTLEARNAAPEALVDVYTHALRLAEEASDRERQLYSHMMCIRCLLTLGDVSGAERHVAMLKKESRWNPILRAELGNYASLQALMGGRLAEAERLVNEGMLRAQSLGHWELLGSSLAELYLLRREQGRLAELEDGIRSALEQHPDNAYLRSHLTHLKAEVGQIEQASDLFECLAEDDFASVARQAPRIGPALLAEACVLLGDRARAEILYGLLQPEARYNVIVGNMAVSWGSAARPLGLLASFLGRFVDAERHFEDALAMDRSIGARLWVVRTQCDLAQLLYARGDDGGRQRARELVKHALTTAHEFDLAGLADRATALQRTFHGVIPLRATLHTSKP
jgi:tetratricopeptide (TPR) repeat protein